MQTVCKWERRGLPIAERGRAGRASLYREADVRAWLGAREAAAKERAAGAGIGLDVAQERAKKEGWQARLAEQQYLARQGELLPRAEVERAWGAERDAIRTKLLALPVSYADRVFRAATLHGVTGVEAALRDAVFDALRELAAGAGDPKAPSPIPKRGRPRARPKVAA